MVQREGKGNLRFSCRVGHTRSVDEVLAGKEEKIEGDLWVTVRGMEVHRIANGKVAETWVCDDLPSILMQLGVIPPPPVTCRPLSVSITSVGCSGALRS